MVAARQGVLGGQEDEVGSEMQQDAEAGAARLMRIQQVCWDGGGKSMRRVGTSPVRRHKPSDGLSEPRYGVTAPSALGL